MVNKEEILNFVKAKGPVIPNHIKKVFGGDTYLISAYLSELSNEGLVKISHTKIGGSPTYYVSGQEFKLQELKKYLNEKDQRTFELLKQRKVLKDNIQDMLIRVGLRNIKDFAKQLDVKIGGKKEIFWKWYLTPNNEVEEIIKKDFAKIIQPPTEEKIIRQETLVTKDEEIKKEKAPEPKQVEEGFLKQINDYFKEKNIEVVKEDIIRKNSELEFQIIIPSSVGNMDYYCKAKNKKKCNDGDLSSAYIKGQSLKLPVLFITTGDITKKATQMLDKEFKGMVVKKI